MQLSETKFSDKLIEEIEKLKKRQEQYIADLTELNKDAKSTYTDNNVQFALRVYSLKRHGILLDSLMFHDLHKIGISDRSSSRSNNDFAVFETHSQRNMLIIKLSAIGECSSHHTKNLWQLAVNDGRTTLSHDEFIKTIGNTIATEKGNYDYFKKWNLICNNNYMHNDHHSAYNMDIFSDENLNIEPHLIIYPQRCF